MSAKAKRVAVIGAGLSGLLLGYYARKRGFEVSVFEASGRCGGIIGRDVYVKDAQGWRVSVAGEGSGEELSGCEGRGLGNAVAIVDHGPIYARNQGSVRSLFDELGIGYLGPVNCSRYIEDGGRIRRFRLSFGMLLEMARCSFRRRKGGYESLGEFVDYHYGERFSRVFVQAIANGVHGVSIDDLSCGIAFRRLNFLNSRACYFYISKFYLFLKFLASRCFGLGDRVLDSGVVCPVGGFDAVIGKLVRKLGESVCLECEVLDLRSLEGYDAVLLTVPSYAAIKIANLPEWAYSALNRIKYTTLGVLTVCVDYGSGMLKDGIGYLSSSGSGIIGVLKCPDSSVLGERYMVFYAGVFDSGLFGGESALRMFKDKFDTEVGFSCFQVYERAIPLYNIDLEDFMAQNDRSSEFGTVKFFGNYTSSLGFGDIVSSAEKLVRGMSV